MEDRLMTKDDLATYLGVPPRTLDEWRYAKIGPPGYRVGRYVRYVRAEVDVWLREQSQDQRKGRATA